MFNLSSSRSATFDSWSPSDHLYSFLWLPQTIQPSFPWLLNKNTAFKSRAPPYHYPFCDCPDDCILHAVSPCGREAFSKPLLKSKSTFQGYTSAMKFFLTPQPKWALSLHRTPIGGKQRCLDSYLYPSYLAPFGLSIAKGKGVSNTICLAHSSCLIKPWWLDWRNTSLWTSSNVYVELLSIPCPYKVEGLCFPLGNSA